MSADMPRLSWIHEDLFKSADVEVRAPVGFGLDRSGLGRRTQIGNAERAADTFDAEAAARQNDSRNGLGRDRRQAARQRDGERHCQRRRPQRANGAAVVTSIRVIVRPRKALERRFDHMGPSPWSAPDKENSASPKADKGHQYAEPVDVGLQTCEAGEVTAKAGFDFDFEECACPSCRTHGKARALPARLQEEHGKIRLCGGGHNV